MTLPVRNLLLGEPESEELESNLWNDRFVSAVMRTNGQSAKVKVRYRGGHTRGYPKRSYEIVRAGRTFHYNAEFDDPSMIRNALSFYFLPTIGVPSPRAKHVMLYRNGEPLGVYLEIEGVGRRFFHSRGIGYSSLFYAVNNNADFGLRIPETSRYKPTLLAGYEHRFGGATEKGKLTAFIRGLNEKNGIALKRFLEARLDIDNSLRWLAGAVLTGNYDGFEQNYAIYRHSKTGKFRIIPWDYEGTWGRNCYGKLVSSDLVDVTGYNYLSAKLLELPELRSRYRTILSKAIRGPFTESALMPKVHGMLGKIVGDLSLDPHRRQSRYELMGEAEVIRHYIRERRSIIASALQRL
ncbi:CotH kinase family protein [Cohnella fermenti]|uniref:Spore coat protein CotH n=1 Tax=Cohnella fermenti TaxID=2565925 RepID=A0A4S4C7I6_9BACL|nr:CotH kinase family protein [Cohnella fermenti]THF83851.1 spore coat protein CotH [Cohnella fermenti]